MSCGDFIQPFDLQCLFVNTLAGTMEIFSFLAVLLIAGLTGYFRMSGALAMSMIGLFVVIMGAYIGFQIYILVLFIVGLSTFWAFAKR